MTKMSDVSRFAVDHFAGTWRLSMVRCWLRLVPAYLSMNLQSWFLFPRVVLPRLDPFSGGNQGPSLALPSNISKTKKVEGRSQSKKNHRFPWRNHKFPWKSTNYHEKKRHKFPSKNVTNSHDGDVFFFPDSQFCFFHSCIICSKKKATENSSL